MEGPEGLFEVGDEEVGGEGGGTVEVLGEAVVLGFELMVFASFPDVVEAESVGVGYYAVACAVDYACVSCICRGGLVDGQRECCEHVVASEFLAVPHLDVFGRIERVVDLAHGVATDGIVAQDCCGCHEYHTPDLLFAELACEHGCNHASLGVACDSYAAYVGEP